MVDTLRCPEQTLSQHPSPHQNVSQTVSQEWDEEHPDFLWSLAAPCAALGDSQSLHSISASRAAQEGFSILLMAMKRWMSMCVFQKFSHERVMRCALLCPARFTPPATSPRCCHQVFLAAWAHPPFWSLLRGRGESKRACTKARCCRE